MASGDQRVARRSGTRGSSWGLLGAWQVQLTQDRYRHTRLGDSSNPPPSVSFSCDVRPAAASLRDRNSPTILAPLLPICAAGQVAPTKSDALLEVALSERFRPRSLGRGLSMGDAANRRRETGRCSSVAACEWLGETPADRLFGSHHANYLRVPSRAAQAQLACHPTGALLDLGAGASRHDSCGLRR